LQGKLRLKSWLLFFAYASLCCCSQQINYPAPGISSLSPTEITAGQPGFTLTVNGSQFTPATTVTWNGVPQSTIFQSTNVLTAQIQAAYIANPAFVLVNVFTPQPGGGSAQTPLQFTIEPVTNPVPQITSMAPQVVSTGSASFAIDLIGTNFVAQSNVTLNGNNIPTIFVNPAAIQATIPASAVANSGTIQIAVVNPPQNSNPNIPPGGGSSNIVGLSVTNPVPAITGLTPASFGAGSASSSLAVAGSNFVPNSVVLIDGQPRTTAFGGSATLNVQLTTSDLASAGADQVEVVNPAPGGGTSTILAFAVTPSTAAGLPVLVDVAPDGSQANNGVCGGLTKCQNSALGLVPGVLTPLTSSGPSTDGSGGFVAFASLSNNLVLNQQSTGSQIFLRNTCLTTSTTSTTCVPATSLVTGSPNGAAANGPSAQPTVDSGGSHVAFTSLATNLVTTPAVTSGTSQVYWTPACTSAVIISGTGCTATAGSQGAVLVSVSADGLSAGNGNSYDSVISSDGEFVAFVSLATNLVTSDTLIDGITPQVFVRTLCNPTTSGGVTSTSCTPTTYLVSSVDGVTPGNGASSQPSIANNGTFVAFTSLSSNLGPNAPNPGSKSEIFEQSECFTTTDCVETMNLISTPDAGATAADGASIEPSISDDGRFVAFASTATNLIPGVGPVQQIYLYDTCTGISAGTTCAPTVKLVSTPDGTSAANALTEYPSINRCGGLGTCATGQFVAFSTKASNLNSSVANGVENIFVRNTCAVAISTSTSTAPACAPATALASRPGGASPNPSDGDSLVPSISGDGHSVGFLSFSNNLVPRDTNNLEDIFLGSTSF
jgi:hypothetical protein